MRRWPVYAGAVRDIFPGRRVGDKCGGHDRYSSPRPWSQRLPPVRANRLWCNRPHRPGRRDRRQVRHYHFRYRAGRCREVFAGSLHRSFSVKAPVRSLATGWKHGCWRHNCHRRMHPAHPDPARVRPTAPAVFHPRLVSSGWVTGQCACSGSQGIRTGQPGVCWPRGRADPPASLSMLCRARQAEDHPVCACSP